MIDNRRFLVRRRSARLLGTQLSCQRHRRL